MVRSLGWLLAALASLGPGVAANQRDSEVVIQRHFKGDIYTTSKWSVIYRAQDSAPSVERKNAPSFHVLSVVSHLKCGCLANLLLVAHEASVANGGGTRNATQL